MTREYIGHDPGFVDGWICNCGNTDVALGFHPCDESGMAMEPASGWKRLYACQRCGRIIKQSTREVIGWNTILAFPQ